MAATTVNCKEFWYIGHNNNTSNAESSTTGWHTWKEIAEQTAFDYAGPKGDANGRLVCICFKADVPTNGGSLEINLNIPAIRQSGTAKYGTLFAKVYANVDPTKKTSGGKKVKITKKEAKKLIPTASNCDGQATWKSTNLEVFNIPITITSDKVKKDEWCYIVLGSSKLLQIGYDSTAGRKFSGTVSYYTDVTAGTITITDNENNSFKVTCTAGTAGINNPIKKTGLQIAQARKATGEWDWSTEEKDVLTKTVTLTNITTNLIKNIAAQLTTYGTYGDSASIEQTADISQYVAPKLPGTPQLFVSNTAKTISDLDILSGLTWQSYERLTRLTNKKLWKFSWAEAEKRNANSEVVGYRIRLYQNSILVKGLLFEKKANRFFLHIDEDKSNEYVDTDNDLVIPLIGFIENPYVIIDPKEFDFQPGDKIKLSITAYTRDGMGNVIYNIGNTITSSAEYLIQNAGVVRVKVTKNNVTQWAEGQVWVKIDSTTWKEADVVKVKTSNGWAEST